jgi:hypothetical protein
MTAGETTTLSVRIAAKTLCLLQREAGRIRVPVGAYIRHILEGHACALLQDAQSVEENSAAAIAQGDSEGANGEMAKAGKSDGAGKIDDGRPTYHLVRKNYRWSIEPFECGVSLRRKEVSEGNQEIELEVLVFNMREDRRDEWGNPVACGGATISSSRRGEEAISPATTYEGAVEAINAHKASVEEALRCHLDLSALADGEKFFTR